MNKLEIIYNCNCVDYNEHILYNNEITSRFIADNMVLNSNLHRVIIYQYNNSKTIYKGNTYKNIISGFHFNIKKVWL